MQGRGVCWKEGRDVCGHYGLVMVCSLQAAQERCQWAFIARHPQHSTAHMVWQMAFGSGFKFNSNVMIANRKGKFGTDTEKDRW